MVRQLVREQRIGYFGVLTGEYEPYLALYAPEDADEVDAQIAAMAECLEQHGRVRSRDLPAPNRDRDGNGWRSLVLRHGEFLGLGTLREGVLISWEALGADFKTVEGVVHVAQPDSALAVARAVIPDDPWRLGAVHTVTTLTGSALLALAIARGAVSADAAWEAAHVDEDWNMAQWGRDTIALQRRAFRFAEFKAAAVVLDALTA